MARLRTLAAPFKKPEKDMETRRGSSVSGPPARPPLLHDAKQLFALTPRLCGVGAAANGGHVLGV